MEYFLPPTAISISPPHPVNYLDDVTVGEGDEGPSSLRSLRVLFLFFLEGMGTGEVYHTEPCRCHSGASVKMWILWDVLVSVQLVLVLKCNTGVWWELELQ